jgi:pilus assembly protein Flp/PilA
MARLKTQCLVFLCDEAGVTALEYGFIAALIAVVVIVGMTLAGGSLSGLWDALGTCMASYGTNCPI